MMRSGSDWSQFNVLLCMEFFLLERLVCVKLLKRNYTECGERYTTIFCLLFEFFLILGSYIALTNILYFWNKRTINNDF